MYRLTEYVMENNKTIIINEIENVMTLYKGYDYKDIAAECSEMLSVKYPNILHEEAYNGFACPRAWWDWYNRYTPVAAFQTWYNGSTKEVSGFYTGEEVEGFIEKHESSGTFATLHVFHDMEEAEKEYNSLLWYTDHNGNKFEDFEQSIGE